MNFNFRSSASSMRDSVMSTQMNIQHRFTHQNNWGFLRNRLVQAKMSDVFSNIRFTVNGSNIRALRCIGEGGKHTFYIFREIAICIQIYY